MDSEKEKYNIEFTEDCRNEIIDVYKYISDTLGAENAAKNLMKKIRDKVMGLALSPRMYAKIQKRKSLKEEFRRMVVDNYIILYTVDERKKVVIIGHMYYGKCNY